ncbi:MAG: DegV family protein [Chloroflexaceae bacterium]|nr:DegV family protein [Chloroflexaceae bacterium]
MSGVKIVTDSASDIPLGLAEELGIEVVPLMIRVDDTMYRAGYELSSEQFYALVQEGDHRLAVMPPSPNTFEKLYRSFALEYDAVFSIHLSSRITGTYRAAVQACARMPASLTRIELIDSKSASMGFGTVALAAARAARDGASPDEMRMLISSMMQHTHIVFFVDTLDYLDKMGPVNQAAAVLGSMQRIKPLMILDDGEIVPYERTRTRAKAIEGLYTFVEDFPHVQDVTVLYSTTPEDVEKLLEKVDLIFPRDRVTITQFAPSTGIYLGPGSMGVAVFEGFDDDLHNGQHHLND